MGIISFFTFLMFSRIDALKLVFIYLTIRFKWAEVPEAKAILDDKISFSTVKPFELNVQRKTNIISILNVNWISKKCKSLKKSIEESDYKTGIEASLTALYMAFNIPQPIPPENIKEIKSLNQNFCKFYKVLKDESDREILWEPYKMFHQTYATIL